jgi:polysaccharide transporter, PST family
MPSEIRRLVTNFFSLTLLRGFDRISPLITLPFLTRTLGLELVGTLVLIKSLCYYFSIFTGYGFAYSATRRVALDKSDSHRLNEIVSSVTYIKTCVLIVCAAIIYGLTLFSPTYAAIQTSLWLYFFVVAIGAYFPTWLFQGMETMQLITTFNVLFKSAMIVWMFIFIKGPGDFELYLKMLALFEVLRVLTSWGFVYYKWKVCLVAPKILSITSQLKEGIYIFLSNLSIQSYGRLPAIVIAPYFGLKAVGAYAVGARLIRSLTALIEPLMQAFFPYVSRKIDESPQKGTLIALTFLKWMSAIGLLIGGLLFIFANEIIHTYSGYTSYEAALVLKALAFVPLVVVISNILGLEILVPLEQGPKYSLVMWLTAALCALCVSLLVPNFSAFGAGISILVAESFAAVLMSYFAYKALINLKRFRF